MEGIIYLVSKCYWKSNFLSFGLYGIYLGTNEKGVTAEDQGKVEKNGGNAHRLSVG